MDYSFLDSIYEDYENTLIDCMDRRRQNGEILFLTKYISPEIKKDRHEGMEMEDMFNRALAESSRQSFKNGFKACMRFMAECFEPKNE